MTTVSVPPRLPRRPTSPSRPLLAACLLLLAGCTGEVIGEIVPADADFFPLPYDDADLPDPPDASEEPPDAASAEPPDAESLPDPDASEDQDAATEPADTGIEPTDAGPAPADTGTAPADSGVPPADASLPSADAAAPGSDASGAGLDAAPAPPDAASPGPDAGAPRPDASTATPDAGSTILNPFYTTPTWRLWTQDESPVHYQGYNLNDPVLKEADFQPTALASRKFPDLSFNGYPFRFLALLAYDPLAPPSVAGFWDDAYATRDGAHTVLGNSWSNNYGNSIDLTGQYVRVNFGSCGTSDLLQLGVNFTSESYSNHGHQLISSSWNVDYTERYFTFINTVRGTPAYLSYAETIADRAVDSYDALYAHSFESVGRSGSETGALFKMLVAGGYLPRTTKDLLKRHGAYSLALISLFRQSLPFAEADGTPVGIGHELRHRPAYFSYGWNTSQEFVPRNAVYHQYDEPQHLYEMIQGARGMAEAPPVAIVKLLGITVEKAGAKLVDDAPTDARVKAANKTLLRVWGNDGETLTLRVDAGSSYDLQGRPLSFEWHPVYPNLSNVTVTPEGGSVWRIRVQHDPTLPKGRIPVALFARAGASVSNPAFVNVYWPAAGQAETPAYVTPSNPNPLTEVHRNLRPVFGTNLPSDWLNLAPGATATVDLSCTDPESFPVRFYRWLGEAGTLAGTRWTFTAPATDPGLVYPLHLLCSDGTGAVSGLLVRVAVTPSDAALPAPWQSTVFGLPEASGSISVPAANTFELVGNGPDLGGQDGGRMLFQPASGDVELGAKVLDLSVDGSTSNSSAKGGVMIRDGLGGGARAVFAYVQGNKKSTTPLSLGGRVRADLDASYAGKGAEPLLATAPQYLKAVRRGGRLAAFASGDGALWEQLWTAAPSTLPAATQVGLALLSADSRRGDAVTYARGRFELLPAPAVGLPVVAFGGTPSTSNTYQYKTSATVTLLPAAAGDELRYTTDGSTPTAGSTLYTAPFDLTAVGDTTLKVVAFSGGVPSGTVALVVKVVP